LDFLPIFVLHQGGLAQLARALAWHARGHQFDPGILHFSEAVSGTEQPVLFSVNFRAMKVQVENSYIYTKLY
jgi:hypothetical protein